MRLISVPRETPSSFAAWVWFPPHSCSASTMRARSAFSGAVAPSRAVAIGFAAGHADGLIVGSERPLSDRVYTITCTSKDASGNATKATTQVVVPHD